VYWCRQCGKHGDVIQFLREKEGLSFGEACAKAGLSGKGKGTMDPQYLLRPRAQVSRDEKQLRLVAAIEDVRSLMQVVGYWQMFTAHVRGPALHEAGEP